MTYEEALEFFARHGNVSSDKERLAKSRPTQSELDEAGDKAISRGQSAEDVELAKRAIRQHYEEML